jgi:hypothetical protein
MKSFIATMALLALVLALSWARVIVYPEPAPQIGDSLDTSIAKADLVFRETGVWDFKPDRPIDRHWEYYRTRYGSDNRTDNVTPKK